MIPHNLYRLYCAALRCFLAQPDVNNLPARRALAVMRELQAEYGHFYYGMVRGGS